MTIYDMTFKDGLWQGTMSNLSKHGDVYLLSNGAMFFIYSWKHNDFKPAIWQSNPPAWQEVFAIPILLTEIEE